MKTQIEFHFPSLDQAAGKIAECVASGFTYVGAVERAGFYYITMEMDVVVDAAEPAAEQEPVEPEPEPVKKARSSKKVVKDE